MSFSTLTSPLSFPLPKSNPFSYTHSSHLISHLSFHYLSFSLTLSSLYSLSLTLTHSLISLFTISHSLTVFSNSLTLTSPSHSHSLSILPKGIFSPNFKFFSLICDFGVSFEFVRGLGLSIGWWLEFGLDLGYNNFREDYANFLLLFNVIWPYLFFCRELSRLWRLKLRIRTLSKHILRHSHHNRLVLGFYYCTLLIYVCILNIIYIYILDNLITIFHM